MDKGDVRFASLIGKIQARQRRGDVAEFSLGKREIRLRAVGEDDAWVNDLKNEYADIKLFADRRNVQAYYFLSHQELRPGSGIIRSFGGRSEGPGGTLTCFLLSKDGRKNYFVAAGHVLSNFWECEDVNAAFGDDPKPTASIYRYQKGYPATNSTRFLGKLFRLSPKPQPINREPAASVEACSVTADIGIVKMRGAVEPVQRTTCYGTFGELPASKDGIGCKSQIPKIEVGLEVMKCGAEEPHMTFAVVANTSTPVSVYGPNGLIYRFNDQVILEVAPAQELESTDPPKDWSAQKYRDSQVPFAVPGDSGSMVVDRKSRVPVGMLIAGSVLDGRYVMTPVQNLCGFWENLGLVMRRG